MLLQARVPNGGAGVLGGVPRPDPLPCPGHAPQPGAHICPHHRGPNTAERQGPGVLRGKVETH